MRIQKLTKTILYNLSETLGSSSDLYKNFETTSVYDLFRIQNGNIRLDSTKEMYRAKYQGFRNAIKALSLEPNLSITNICNVHKYLDEGNSNFGLIRESNIRLGKEKHSESTFYPPKKDNLNKLFANWLTLETNNAAALLFKYFSFLHIHPFNDGNGRFSRVFLMSKDEQFGNFALYLVATRGEKHNEIVKMSTLGSFPEMAFPYLSNYRAWNNKANEFVEEAIIDTLVKISKKIGLMCFTIDINTLNNYLLTNPFFLLKEIKLVFPQVDNILSFFVSENLIKQVPDIVRHDIFVFIPSYELHERIKKYISGALQIMHHR